MGNSIPLPPPPPSSSSTSFPTPSYTLPHHPPIGPASGLSPKIKGSANVHPTSHADTVFPSHLDHNDSLDQYLANCLTMPAEQPIRPQQLLDRLQALSDFPIHAIDSLLISAKTSPDDKTALYLHTLNQAIRPFLRTALLPSASLILSVFAEELAKLSSARKLIFVFAPRESAAPDNFYYYALDQKTGALWQSALVPFEELYSVQKVIQAIGVERMDAQDEKKDYGNAQIVKLDSGLKLSPIAIVFPKDNEPVDLACVERFGRLLVPLLLNPSRNSSTKTRTRSEFPGAPGGEPVNAIAQSFRVHKFLAELDLHLCIELILESYAKEFPADVFCLAQDPADKGSLSVHLFFSQNKEHAHLILNLSDLEGTKAEEHGLPEPISEVIKGLFFTKKTEIWNDTCGGFSFSRPNGVVACLKKSGFVRRPDIVRSSITAYAEVALRNAAVWQKQKKAVQQSQALLVVSQKLTSETDLETLLELMMDVLAELTSADMVSLFLASEDQTELVKFNSKHISEIRIPKDSGIAGMVYASGNGINVADAYEHPKFNPAIDFQLGYRTQSLLCAPIKLFNESNKIIGVVQLINKKSHDTKKIIPFDEDDAALVNAFCSQAAVSISKSRMFHEITKSQKRNELLLKVSHRISAQLELTQLLSTILELAKELLECKEVDIFLKPNAESKKLVSISNAGRTLDVDYKEDVKTEFIMQVRLMHEDRVIGVIEALAKIDGKAFTDEEYHLLSGLAAQASIAVSNSQLFNEVRAMKDYLESIQRSIGDYIIMVNVDLDIEFSNRDMSNLFGPAYKTVKFQVLVGDNSKLFKDVQLVLKGEEKISSKDYRLPKGAIVDYAVVKHVSQVGKPASALVILHDVSEKTHMQTQLEGYKASITNFEQKMAEMQKSMRKMRDNLVQVSESPIQAVIRKLHETIDLRGDFELQKKTIEECLELLKSKDLFQPALMDEDSLETDEEMQTIKEYLLSEVGSAIVKDSVVLTESESVSNKRISLRGDALPENDKLRTWAMNSLGVKTADLCVWSSKLFRDAVFRKKISPDIDFDLLDNFIVSILRQYRDNPFHNPAHGVSVLQATYLLMSENVEAIPHSELEGLGLMVAALCHDVDHPGRTNAFEISRNSELAVLYNDKSVLENHHCAVTFQTLYEDQNNFIQKWDRDRKKYFREIIVQSILGTDMAKHFQMVAQFNDVRILHQPPNGQVLSPDSIKKIDIAVLEYLVHCADLSNGVRPFEVSSEWSKSLDLEFKAQIAEERALGLPVSTFLLAETRVQFAKRELNFHAQIVSPLWAGLAKRIPTAQPLVNQLKSNVDKWQQILLQAELESETIPEETKHP